MKVIGLQRAGSTPPDTNGIARLAPEEFLPPPISSSLHCPLTPDTERLINASTLRLMKPTACLINTARGPLVDEAALIDALRRGVVGGAALDVLSVEPPAPTQPLLAANLPNLIITPHTAWATTESRLRLLDGVRRNLTAFLAGEELPDRVV